MIKSKAIRVHLAAAFAAVLLVSFMVVRTSSAAFSDTVSASQDSFGANTVKFDDLASAVFSSGTGILPGYDEVACVEVTYSGSANPSTATKLYGAVSGTDGTPASVATTDGSSLDDHLDLSVVIGDATVTCATLTTTINTLGVLNLVDGTTGTTVTGGTEIYDNALASFNTSASPITTSWTPQSSSDQMRAFAFVLSLPTATTNQAQGDSATATFTWSTEQ